MPHWPKPSRALIKGSHNRNAHALTLAHPHTDPTPGVRSDVATHGMQATAPRRYRGGLSAELKQSGKAVG